MTPIQSFERTHNGRPRHVGSSFSALRRLPLRAAQLQR